MPTEKGKDGSACVLTSAVAEYVKAAEAATDKFWMDPATGFKFTVMCSGAIAQASATAGALVAAVIASTY